MRLKEHRAELLDSQINFLGFSEPKEINYFNLEDQVTVYEQDWSPSNNLTSVVITLGSRLVREKRIVYDTFMMLGDVGGLNDFFGLTFSIIFGLFSEQFMQAHLIRRLLREPVKQDQNTATSFQH